MRISDWSSDVGSSDLGKHTAGARSIAVPAGIAWQASSPRPLPAILASLNNRFLPPRPAWRTIGACLHRQVAMQTAPIRSEEHTSELQSLMRISYAVFCLKKKKTHITIIINFTINIYAII